MAIRDKNKEQFERKNKTKTRKMNQMGISEVRSELERMRTDGQIFSLYFRQLRQRESALA